MSPSTAHQTGKAIEARRRHTDVLLQRVREALAALRRERAAITFRAVERRAGVSRSFLYQNETARALIAEATADADKLRAAGREAAAESIDAAWRERALNAEDGLKQATAEIRGQRQQIGELMGRIRDLEADLPADAVQRLVSENTTLRNSIRQLTGENKTLSERLTASRGNGQSQASKIAELQAMILEHHPTAAGRHLRAVPDQGTRS